jgi:Kef-type K+ transport system membrane component KefB
MITLPKRGVFGALALMSVLLISNYEIPVYAAGGANAHDHSLVFLWIAIMLVAAKLWSFAEKYSIPNVLGELLTGIIFGNLFLFGISFFEPIKTDDIFMFLAQLGAVILLFQVGLESNLSKLMKCGGRSLLIATVGVIAPFVFGMAIIPVFFPGGSLVHMLFFGAALTATSVGITARVFQEFGKLQSSGAQLVLGAAVLDDVLGLTLLAIVSSVATSGSFAVTELAMILFKTVVFIVGSILLGQLIAPYIGKAFSRINTGTGMKFTMAVSFGLFFAYVAQAMGLEPIIGAFAAGLVLDPVHFKYFKDVEVIQDVKNALDTCKDESRQRVLACIEPHAHKQIEEIIEPVSLFLVPLFFIYTGFQVQLATFADIRIILIALVVTLGAVITKMVSGVFAPKGDKLLVGLGMVPRGEVGLIFATIGQSLGVLSPDMFAVVVLVVVLTTFITPVLIGIQLRGESEKLERHYNSIMRSWRKRLRVAVHKFNQE